MELADLDLNKVYTYADYFKWKLEERVELIKGKIFKMSPSPNLIHQRISSRIHTKLGSHLDGGKCEVFSAPFDVRLPRKSKEDKDIITVVQPDICVVCNPAILDSKGCVGAPDIVVEILSPSNTKKELKYKYEVYEEAGVKEYWVVFPPEESIMMYTLVEGKFVASRFKFAGDAFTSAVLPGFSLDLTQLFANIPGREEE
jgi:Uma2 family endonuclease